jgi:hypothetical protein
MSNGGVKFDQMHTAHRYRDILCSACGVAFLAYGQRKICDECKKAKAHTPEARQRAYAQRAVTRAIAKGELVRSPCAICSAYGNFEPRSHGHHEDYSKPLDVIWLCAFHHIKRHEQINALIEQGKPSPPVTSDELVAAHIRDRKETRAKNPTWKLNPAPWDPDYVPADYETSPTRSGETIR